MANQFSIVDFEAEEKLPSQKSGVPRVELGELLGCEQLHTRVWYLDPGDSMRYHRQREQEEVYVPLEGSGRLRIGDEIVDVPEGSAVRVPPETPRQLTNDGDRQHVWLVVGAPPVADDGVPLDAE